MTGNVAGGPVEAPLKYSPDDGIVSVSPTLESGFAICSVKDSGPALLLIASVGTDRDDYLTKPFSFDVLSARLRLITRRNMIEGTDVMQVSDLTLNSPNSQIRRRRI